MNFSLRSTEKGAERTENFITGIGFSGKAKLDDLKKIKIIQNMVAGILKNYYISYVYANEERSSKQ